MSIIFCCACFLGSILYLVYLLKKHKGSTLKENVFLFGYVGVLVVFAISFLFYNPYNLFGFLPLWFNVFTIYSGFILAHFFFTDKSKKIIMYIFAGGYLALTVWKILFFKDEFVRLLPLNVCNILILFIMIKPFKQIKFLEQYIVVFGIIAGIVNIVMGQFYDGNVGTNLLGEPWVYTSFGKGFFYYRMFESTILHSFFFTYAIYTMKTRLINVNVKDGLPILIAIPCYFAVMVIFNQIFKTDYFFTGKYPITPKFLIDLQDLFPGKIYFTLGNVDFELIPLYYVFLVASALGIFVLLDWLLSILQRKFVPLETKADDLSKVDLS